MKTDFTNFEAYFLGPMGENADFFKKLMLESFDDHVAWRRQFHETEAVPFITDADKNREDFKRSTTLIQGKFRELQNKLKLSQPFFSPRYIGHMNWETMMAPTLAFMAAALYNPNNVANAGSTGTSVLELEVGQDFLRLFGFDVEQGWGHICTGGTIANMEALWIARNMKIIPVALKRFLNQISRTDIAVPLRGEDILITKQSDEELTRRWSPVEILEMRDHVLAKLKEEMDDKKVENLFELFGMQELGLKNAQLDTGVVFLPQTKHYSLKKALDLLGIGRKEARYVPVDGNFRMDMGALEEMVRDEGRNNRPILAVVGVVGSTEESSVDEIDRIVSLRERVSQEMGLSFHIHVDAAFGGYVRSLFLDGDGNFMNKQDLDTHLKELGIIGDKEERKYASWPHDHLFEAFKAISSCDTVSVDPHKLGYVLYPAGGIAMRDRRMREVIQTFAPYVFPKLKDGEPDILIGAYILEGSKPGAAAAAVWMAHRIMPLNITGYGKLIGETIDGAQALWHGLDRMSPVDLGDGFRIKAVPVLKPDINIVNYVFYMEGSESLALTNELTHFVTDKIFGFKSEDSEGILGKKFIVVDTDFSKEEYGDSPLPFLRRLGIPDEEWHKVSKLIVARSVIMSPYLTPDYVDENYVSLFIKAIEEGLLKNKEALLNIYKKTVK